MTSHPGQTQERGLGCDADVGVGAQEPDPQPERPLASRPERSSSFQEIFSSPRNKLLRQSSLQQQQVSVLHVVSTCLELFSLLHSCLKH